MTLSSLRVSLAGLLFSVALLASMQARADVAAGGHFGLNLDAGHPMLGADLRIDLITLSNRVQMDLWPAYTHVFIEDYHDVDLLEVDVPFLISMPNPHVVPYVAPGLG